MHKAHQGHPCSRFPPLPYADNALEPVISANTISFHYGKHHKTYVDNLNNLVKGTDYESATLEKIITDTAGKADKARSSTTPRRSGTTRSTGTASRATAAASRRASSRTMIDAAFGGFDNFKKEFAATTVSQFGSGWGWLVVDGGKLKIVKTGERRGAVHQGPEAAAHDRRLGARVLPRLPEQARRLRQCGDRQAAQLGLRRARTCG